MKQLNKLIIEELLLGKLVLLDHLLLMLIDKWLISLKLNVLEMN
jgi:hypothetical protein